MGETNSNGANPDADSFNTLRFVGRIDSSIFVFR